MLATRWMKRILLKEFWEELTQFPREINLLNPKQNLGATDLNKQEFVYDLRQKGYIIIIVSQKVSENLTNLP